ncbi:hypothetical protein [Acetobacter sp.]|uniref:hypothetical protein n=1 Tax=Acetobacter sp. TaxID=440 RepID=UPI0039EA48F4
MAGFDMNANALLGIGQGMVQPQNNLMPNIAQAAAVQNQLLATKIRQAEYDSRLASGNALLGNTGADGSVNWGKARSDYAQAARSNPSLALGAADNYSANNAARSGTVKATDDELAFQQHASEAAINGMGRVIADPTDANLKGYGAFMTRLTPAASGQIKTIVNQVMSLPTKGQRVEALKAATAAHMGQEASNRIFGTPTMVDDGQTIQSGTQASGIDGGAFTPAGQTQKQTSPEFNSSPMEIINSDGSHSYVRRERVVGNGQGKPTVPAEAMGSGRYQGQDANNPGYQASPAAGQVESQKAAAEVAGHAAGDQFGHAGQLSAGFGDRMYRSQKALQLLQEISPSSGKTGELRNRIINAAVSLGMTTPSDSSAAYDLANKYLTQLAASQPGAAHSDAQLATALAGNPSTHINNLAAQDALRANIALDRRANAAYLEFNQKYPGTAAQVHANEWPAFQNDYTTKRDARAFMFDIMSPAQRDRLRAGMDDKEWAAFRGELRAAMKTGLVQAPR